jgi:hypothetical protein
VRKNGREAGNRVALTEVLYERDSTPELNGNEKKRKNRRDKKKGKGKK